MTITCGEAAMRLLARYGISTVFGIPGVHTLDLCRGLSDDGRAGTLRHVQARHEGGAGFMAEGWARATGRPGVAVVISGPGVTNAATAVAQCWADSLPMLLISAEPATETLGQSWGVLHEMTDQAASTRPMTAFSATAMSAAEIPDLIARAFAVFASARPRPCHISIPVDVQAEYVDQEWEPAPPPARAGPDAALIGEAARALSAASCPLMMLGGGAVQAAEDLRVIAETTDAVVLSSTAGKGIVPDDHPLSLSASTVRPEVQRFVGEADVVLAVGTELAGMGRFREDAKVKDFRLMPEASFSGM